MPDMLESEKLNVLMKEILRNKIANDFTTATKIAESLMAEDARLGEGERYFKQVIFNKVADDLIKWFAGSKLEQEFKQLHDEIASLRNELAEVRKIAVRGAEKAPERKTIKRMVEVEEDAETGEVISKTPSASQHSAAPAPKAEEPKKASVGAGPGRAELDPNDYDVSKIFNFSGGQRNK